MKTAKQAILSSVGKQHHFNVLVCIGLLFIMSGVFLVPHRVYAQESGKDVNYILVSENEQGKTSEGDVPLGLGATGIDIAPLGAICSFSMQGDYVHISSTGFDASGHGWWVNYDCEAQQAIVSIQLQQQLNGSWVNAGSRGQKTVYSGGGSANRAAARAHCNSSTTTLWRSEIDVDLIGSPDTPGKYYTPVRTLNCRH